MVFHQFFSIFQIFPSSFCNANISQSYCYLFLYLAFSIFLHFLYFVICSKHLREPISPSLFDIFFFLLFCSSLCFNMLISWLFSEVNKSIVLLRDEESLNRSKEFTVKLQLHSSRLVGNFINRKKSIFLFSKQFRTYTVSIIQNTALIKTRDFT